MLAERMERIGNGSNWSEIKDIQGQIDKLWQQEETF